MTRGVQISLIFALKCPVLEISGFEVLKAHSRIRSKVRVTRRELSTVLVRVDVSVSFR